jgi:hypothetical protein
MKLDDGCYCGSASEVLEMYSGASEMWLRQWWWWWWCGWSVGTIVFKPTACLVEESTGWDFACSSIHLAVGVFESMGAVERVASRIYV